MLLGSSTNRIDDKGRIVMPAKFRASIGDTVVCTVGSDHSLAVYPMDEWQPYYQKINSLPSTKEALAVKRKLLKDAEELSIDAQGRILLTAALRKHADLTGAAAVVINGVGDHLEIWNSEKWAAYSDENLDNFDENFEEVAAKYGL